MHDSLPYIRNVGDELSIKMYLTTQVGLGAFTWDFWTWFTNGNCSTVVSTIPNFTNTWYDLTSNIHWTLLFIKV